MRVTHVITRLIIGGAQENTIASLLGLRQRAGVETHLITGPDSGPEGSLATSFTNTPELLTFLPQLVRPIHPWKDMLALRRLASIFRSQRPDIVHTHSGKAGVLGRLAAANAGVPVIVHTIHGPSFGSFQGPLPNCMFRFAERRAAKATTHFVVVADAMTRQYLAAGIGKASQYTRILSGFPMAPYLSAANDPALRRKFGIEPQDVVIGKIARFFKLKGHDDLFDIAPVLVRDCPRIRFLLVGDGPWRQRLQQRAKAVGLQDRFIFTGLVAPADIPQLIGIMDILVHLSRREGLARALPQALAAARPVVAYDCDGANEVCRNDETGYLVAPGDLKTLTGRLTRLAADASLRERLGRNGRELVRESFAIEKMIDDLYALYSKLIAQSRMPPS
jgi:glycosyltransferase involved in cell wall biosynthesis